MWTLLVWVASAAADFGLGLISGASEDVRPITLSIGVSLLGEALTLGLRALAGGIPFAPERSSGRAAG